MKLNKAAFFLASILLILFITIKLGVWESTETETEALKAEEVIEVVIERPVITSVKGKIWTNSCRIISKEGKRTIYECRTLVYPNCIITPISGSEYSKEDCILNGRSSITYCKESPDGQGYNLYTCQYEEPK